MRLLILFCNVEDVELICWTILVKSREEFS
jgi:hypothetical protein